jgi:tRNA(Arg) A34 adenosine deaminase TadA
MRALPDDQIDDADVAHLRRCIELAGAARAKGNEPFGSLLVGGDGQVLAEHENVVNTERDVTGHPELTLARWASQHLDADERAAATMYTSCEHCAMCATAHFWAGIGRLVFALDGAGLASVRPAHLPSLALSSREVLARGNRDVAVAGPAEQLRAEALAVHEGFWT